MTSPNELLTPAEAAAFLRYSPRTLANLRYLRQGPAYVRMNGTRGRVAYRAADLSAYVASRIVEPGCAAEDEDAK